MLRHRLREIAAEHIRWARRMTYRIFRREGLSFNHKWEQRRWREVWLQRPTPGNASEPVQMRHNTEGVTGPSIPTSFGLLTITRC
jgi:hypothetical protein